MMRSRPKATKGGKPKHDDAAWAEIFFSNVFDKNIPDDNEERRKWAVEQQRKFRDLATRVPRLEEEVMRLKKEKKEWISTKVNYENDNTMFELENKNLRGAVEAAEKKWQDTKKHRERLESDNADLRKKLFQVERQLKGGSPGSPVAAPPPEAEPQPKPPDGFIGRMRLARKRLKETAKAMVVEQPKPQNRVVSQRVLQAKTESFHQTIISLQNELNAANEQKTALEGELEAAKMNHETLAQTNRDYEQLILDLKGELKTATNDLRSKRAELQHARNEHKEQLKDVAKQRQDLEFRIERESSSLDLSRKSLATEQSRMKKGHAELERLRGEFARIEKELDSRTTSLQTTQDELAKLQSKYQSANADLSSARTNFQARQTRLDQQVYESQSQLKHRDQRIESLQEQIGALDTASKDRDLLANAIPALQAEVAQARTELQESGARHETELLEALKPLDEMSEELDKSNAEVDRLKLELEETSGKKEEVVRLQRDLEELKTRHRTEIEARDAQVSKLLLEARGSETAKPEEDTLRETPAPAALDHETPAPVSMPLLLPPSIALDMPANDAKETEPTQQKTASPADRPDPEDNKEDPEDDPATTGTSEKAETADKTETEQPNAARGDAM